MDEPKPTKEQIVNLLHRWINQRPGLEYGNYGDFSAYNSEMRHITKQKHDAETLLRAVELSNIDADTLLGGFRAYSGRLEIKFVPQKPDMLRMGEFRLSYCTGQYWPTEYRAAACAVLASALWDYYRPDYVDMENPGDKIRAAFKRMFGKRMQETWFD